MRNYSMMNDRAARFYSFESAENIDVGNFISQIQGKIELKSIDFSESPKWMTSKMIYMARNENICK